ncbi:MAG: hypothetical protein L5655_10260 [Thermosediminibacteraceae bacterium]|nr:hypothetical protein [Thermosediminibacteraceae bacterium]
MKNKNVLATFCLVIFLMSLSEGVIPFIPLIGEEMGVSTDTIFYSYAGSSLISAIFSYIGGKMADASTRRKQARLGGFKLLLPL